MLQTCSKCFLGECFGVGYRKALKGAILTTEDLICSVMVQGYKSGSRLFGAKKANEDIELTYYDMANEDLMKSFIDLMQYKGYNKGIHFVSPSEYEKQFKCFTDAYNRGLFFYGSEKGLAFAELSNADKGNTVVILGYKNGLKRRGYSRGQQNISLSEKDKENKIVVQYYNFGARTYKKVQSF